MSSGEELERIEGLIRSGQISDAQRALKKFSAKEASVIDKTKAAGLARRASLPQLSLKWLFNTVYPDGRLDRECSTRVLLEYGASLVFAGALVEGRNVLELALQRNEKHALLYMAFSFIREWDYENAALTLKKFLWEASPDPYTKLIANVNLLAALVRIRPQDPETLALTQEVLRSSKANYKRLYINGLELCVQLHVSRDDYGQAEKYLRELSALSPNEESPEYLFWNKWKLILKYHQADKKSAEPLHKLVQLARDAAHGESLRDGQMRLALHEQNQLLFEHVYRGTPHKSFRAQAEKDYKSAFGTDFMMGQHHYFLADRTGFHPLEKIPEATNTLNLSTGFLLEAGATAWHPEFKTQFLPFKLLQTICEDFYQAKNIVELSAHLYPGSQYHPLNSTQGVFQLLKRMNAALEGISPTSRIELDNSRYILRSPQLLLVKGSHGSSIFKEEWNLLDTFSKESDRYFSRKELETISNVAPRSLSRYLDKLVQEQEIIVVGKGPNTRYLRNPEKKGSLAA